MVRNDVADELEGACRCRHWVETCGHSRLVQDEGGRQEAAEAGNGDPQSKPKPHDAPVPPADFPLEPDGTSATGGIGQAKRHMQQVRARRG